MQISFSLPIFFSRAVTVGGEVGGGRGMEEFKVKGLHPKSADRDSKGLMNNLHQPPGSLAEMFRYCL